MSAKVLKSQVLKLSKLANLPLSSSEKNSLQKNVGVTLDYVSSLSKLNLKEFEPTSQVTGLYNVFREDKIDKKRMLSQKQALMNSKKTYKGYFVVSAIIDKS